MIVLREGVIHVCSLRESQADYFHGVKIKSHNMFNAYHHLARRKGQR